jgi:ABC-type microcin C transport system permease subunit YejB
MRAYILRRLMLMVPTLIGIMVINFFVIQAAPGGPVEQRDLTAAGPWRRHHAHHR